ncbi:MAG: glutamate decarboxylase [bacterium]|nr:glutamate decarboxylase [bacterium]
MTMRDSLRHAFELATEMVDLERRAPLREHRQPEELLAELDLTLCGEGQPMPALLDSLRQLYRETPRIASSRFFNQLFGGRDPVATLAEILTVVANNPMYTYKAGGAQVLVEREVLRHMASKAGFEGGDGMFSPGGSLSNLAALVVARNEALEGAREDGLGAGRFRAYTSREGHYSLRRAMGILGLGRNNLCMVPTDEGGRMDAVALRREIETDLSAGVRPVMINATAGTTQLGAFDPLPEIAEVASEHGIWMHVDAAYGGSVLLSPRHRRLLDGCELADSLTWDAHKIMGVPLTCSTLLMRRPGLLAKHLDESAGYLFQGDDDEFNPGVRSLQCGRRNDALKLWAAWRFHGDRGYAHRIDRLFALAASAADRIEADPDLRLFRHPESLNICFQVTGCSASEICERLEREGRLLVGYARLQGENWIRLVCVNGDLDEAGLDIFFGEVKAVAAALAG